MDCKNTIYSTNNLISVERECELLFYVNKFLLIVTAIVV